ncbi:MAG: hypothetical protein HRU11_09070 [Parvularculaceae bacterium]|nr:hypothetical protein [Parvularculaceae bacterium]
MDGLRPVTITPGWFDLNNESFGAQELVNMYAVALPATEKNGFGLAEMPRLTPYLVLGEPYSSVRKLIVRQTDSFVALVRGDDIVIRQFAEGGFVGTEEHVASGAASSGRVFEASSDEVTAVVIDGTVVSIAADGTYATPAEGSVLESDITSVGYLGRRWVYSKNDPNSAARRGGFFFSELDDPLNVPEVNFISAEGDIDRVVGLFATGSDVFVKGSRSIEQFRVGPDPAAPYQPVSQTAQSCGAFGSVALVGEERFWIDRTGVVLRGPGIVGQSISDEAIERRIRETGNWSAIHGHEVQWDGQLFYALTLPGVGCYWYSLKTGLWSQRRSWQRTDWLGSDVSLMGRTTLVGDDSAPVIHTQTSDPASDAGQPFERVFTLPEVHSGMDDICLSELVIEGRVGESPLGSEAQMRCQVSKDSGVTFGTAKRASLGRRGQRRKRVRFRTFGRSRTFLPKLTVTDPVLFSLTGAYIGAD